MKIWKPCALLALILWWCGGSPALALDRTNLTFYLSFDNNGLQPQIAAANTQLKFIKGTEKDAQLVEGLRGQGLKVTPALTLHYLTRDSFSAREGTIAFWMKPVGWSGTNCMRFFLLARGDQVVIHFYVFYGCPWLYIAGPTRYDLVGGGTFPSAFDKGEAFPEGKWTFLACTYKPGQQAFYINGKLIIRRTDGLIEPEFTKQGIIEIPQGDQVLDEIMVFDRVLTEQEILEVYQANAPDEK